MDYPVYQQVEPLFLKILTDFLTISNDRTKESLLKSIKAYKITNIAGEDIQITHNQLLVTAKTLCVLNDGVLPPDMIKHYLTILTTTSCTEFNEQFLDLKKQLQFSLLQSLIRNHSQDVTICAQLTHDIHGIKLIINYTIALYVNLMKTSVWKESINKAPGSSGMIVAGR